MTKPSDPKITDTSKQSQEPILLEAMVTGDISRPILAQEARGQKEIVAAGGSRLPAKGTVTENGAGPASDPPLPLLWKEFGIEIGEPVEGDEIWVHAKLPQGWSIRPTDHSMWTKLVDNKDRERASIFYKAAFYDREAFIQPDHRFAATGDPVGRTRSMFGIVTDGGKEIQRFGPFDDDEAPRPRFGDPRFDAWTSGYKKARAAASAWLDEHYPDWNSLTAYWD